MSFLRPTLKDVAKLSGVSEISVSRVMRDAPNISSRLREKVEAAALELHYTPNKVAGALASNTTDLIGVLLPTLETTEYVQVLSGIESVLARSRYRMMLGISDFSSKREIKIVRDLLSWSPSGIIMVGGDHAADTYQLLQRSIAPLIEVLNQENNSTGLGLDFTYKKALDDLLSHWKLQGYKNIAYVESNDDQLIPDSFKEAFKKGLKEINAKLVHQIHLDKPSSIALGLECCTEILQKNPDVDLIFLAGKHFADDISFYHGANITKKVALASIGRLSSLVNNSSEIDLISFPYKKIGEDAAKLLLLDSSKDYEQKQKISLAAEFYRYSPKS